MDVVVFGAGALGSLLGGLLAREHAVTLVGRDPHMAAVAARGLQLTGEVTETVSPRATTALDTDAALAIVTTKAFDTPAAARALAGRSFDAVCSLQNGMGNEATLAARLGCPVLGGTTTFGARLAEPGTVECTGVGEVTLGPARGPDAQREERHQADRAATAFRTAGVDVEVVEAIRPRLWVKLAVNAGINPVTALCRVTNGRVLDPPLEGVAMRAATEAAGVARDQGVGLEDETVQRALREVVATTATNRSSMLVDVEAGRRTEIDAINGYVVRAAEHTVPVNETLWALVRAVGDERGG